MKKMILSLLTLLVGISLFALPPKPGKVRYTQPDGTTVLLELHGNAEAHWYTTENGRKMAKDKDGFWRPVFWEPDWNLRKKTIRTDDGGDEESSESITTGVRHFPVILVNFKDVKFSLDDPVTMISNMLNQQGYSYNGATGSVRDYYYENSHGIFEPVFDVYGPVELEHEMAYYGEDIDSFFGQGDHRAVEVLYEGFVQLDPLIDYSRYDSNGDLEIDMVLMFFAGYNQAEHGPSDSIWPFADDSPYMSGVDFEADGVEVGRFFMTSELRGYTGTNICGIGATAHEFCHALGLPDFYDTDYEGSDGKAGGMYSFSLMSNGCYNNDAKTPPYLNSEEMIMLGWMDEADVQIMPGGKVSLEPVNRKKAFRSYTDMDGEYFVYEYRSGQGWDAATPEGLLIYHVDKSTQITLGWYTPYSLWDEWDSSNSINAYGYHPCCYVIPADDQTNLDYPYKGNQDKMMFPGSRSVTQYTPIDWVGSTTGVSLSDIACSGGVATWKADVNIHQRLLGKVTSTVGVPVPGAKVIVHPLAPATEGVVTVTTDADGQYEAILTGLGWERVSVRASAEGYVSTAAECELNPRKSVLSLQLVCLDDTDDVVICYIDYDAIEEDESGIPVGSRNVRMQFAMYVPAQDLKAHVGKQIKQIRFMPSFFMSEAHSADVFIENGEEELLRVREVPISEEIWYTVDVRDHNLFVEKDEKLYVGWQLDIPDYGFCAFAGKNLVKTTDETSGVAHEWELDAASEEYALACKLVLGEKPVPNPYAARGFNTIQQKDSYKAGDLFDFLLVSAKEDAPSQLSWTFDGAPFVDGDAVRLEAGHHYVEAVLLYPDGRKEILETELEVK